MSDNLYKIAIGVVVVFAIAAMFCFATQPASAHDASTDHIGGHIGEQGYHCHSAVCADIVHERWVAEEDIEDHLAVIRFLEERLEKLAKCVSDTLPSATGEVAKLQ